MLTKAERDTWLADLLDIRPLKDLEAVSNWLTTLRLRLRAALEAHAEADAEIKHLRAELDAQFADFESSFELFADACRRGTELWREANPGCGDIVLPDTAKLVKFLIDEVERLKSMLADVCQASFECAVDRGDISRRDGTPTRDPHVFETNYFGEPDTCSLCGQDVRSEIHLRNQP